MFHLPSRLQGVAALHMVLSHKTRQNVNILTYSDVIGIDIIRVGHSKFQKKRNPCVWIYSASKQFTNITMQNISDANGIALKLHSSSANFYSGTLLTWKDISVSILGLCSRWNIIHGYHIRWNILGSAYNRIVH